jgi:hypothetical protein
MSETDTNQTVADLVTANPVNTPKKALTEAQKNRLFRPNNRANPWGRHGNPNKGKVAWNDISWWAERLMVNLPLMEPAAASQAILKVMDILLEYNKAQEGRRKGQPATDENTPEAIAAKLKVQ